MNTLKRAPIVTINIAQLIAEEVGDYLGNSKLIHAIAEHQKEITKGTDTIEELRDNLLKFIGWYEDVQDGLNTQNEKNAGA